MANDLRDMHRSINNQLVDLEMIPHIQDSTGDRRMRSEPVILSRDAIDECRHNRPRHLAQYANLLEVYITENESRRRYLNSETMLWGGLDRTQEPYRQGQHDGLQEQYAQLRGALDYIRAGVLNQ